jgi:uncharacterized protein YjiS (DUF1127 family)
MVTLQNVSTPTNTPTHPGLSARLMRLVPAVKNIFKAAAHRRALMATLAQADGHMLKDIGITSQDLQAACAGHWWEDPTDQLAKLAQERRSAKSAQTSEMLHVTAGSKHSIAA